MRKISEQLREALRDAKVNLQDIVWYENTWEVVIRNAKVDVAFSLKTILSLLPALLDEHERLEQELERTRVQLAGCLVAAEGHANGTNDCEEGDYGWSESFNVVRTLRNRFERLERENERLKEFEWKYNDLCK